MSREIPLRYRWERCVRADPRVTAGEARAAWGLTQFWNRRTDTAFPTALTVASVSALAEDTAHRAIAKLVRLGYLQKVKKRGMRGSLEVRFTVPEGAVNTGSPSDIAEGPISDQHPMQSRMSVQGNLRSEPLIQSANGAVDDSERARLKQAREVLIEACSAKFGLDPQSIVDGMTVRTWIVGSFGDAFTDLARRHAAGDLDHSDLDRAMAEQGVAEAIAAAKARAA